MRQQKNNRQKMTREIIAYMRRQSRIDARYMNIKYDDYRFRWRNWLKERDKRLAGYRSVLLTDDLNLDNIYVCEAIYTYKERGFF